jgi:hypothetical protein
MDFELQTKVAIYRFFAEFARRPTAQELAQCLGSNVDTVLAVYARLRTQRFLVLEPDGVSIRMAPPFSGVSTQHVACVGVKRYFANCAWDALGIIAALRGEGVVESRCEQSGEALRLRIGREGPEACEWLFHCAVPAAKWWDDIGFT